MTEQHAPSWFDVLEEAQHVTMWTADELDRMIDQVKADAWDEASEATGEHIENGGECALRNPYRKEQDHD